MGVIQQRAVHNERSVAIVIRDRNLNYRIVICDLTAEGFFATLYGSSTESTETKFETLFSV
jgi:hypothetical protein